MDAKDVMTRNVVTVTSATAVEDVARLLFEHRISALPVLDEGRLVGIISEADLLHRYEIGTDCAESNDPWWIRVFSADRSPEDYVKSHALRACDMMTREVITVAPATPLAEIATLIEKRRIKRLPVLEEGRLIGIVSRSDLVRALLAQKQSRRAAAALPDEAIRALLLAELRRQAWWRSDISDVTVEEGIVTYGGVIDAESERTAARLAAESVPGVRGVVDRRIGYRDLPSIV
jgi:CBS domain-containing protein